MREDHVASTVCPLDGLGALFSSTATYPVGYGKEYTIAVIPGDGIGKEVTPWAQKALEKAAEGVADFEYENFDLGAERYLCDGAILPDEELERIKKTDAILLGAVGDPRIKAGILERGLLLKLRFALDQYVKPASVQAVQGRHLAAREPRRHRFRRGA